MKYFLDQEFHHGFHKPLFGKKRHFIDLISIGIHAEDGRQYYAISNEFDLKKVWKDALLRENVLKPIHSELRDKQGVDMFFMFHDLFVPFSYKSLKLLIKWHGKSNDQIAAEIFNFVNPDLGFHIESYSNAPFRDPDSYLSKLFKEHNVKEFKEHFYAQPEFYAYYADYDWVLFCSLFGKMINLPPGFPMYCKDLKQMLDEVASTGIIFVDGKPATLEQRIAKLKHQEDYPQQYNEHNALADAKWNFQLYKFLTTT